MNDLPRILVSTPIEQRLAQLESRANEHEKWGGDSTATAIRMCIAHVREALKEAEEVWEGTASAAELTGWSDETVAKYARMRIDGEALPYEWRNLEARRGAGGYVVRVSTLPMKPRRKSA